MIIPETQEYLLNYVSERFYDSINYSLKHSETLDIPADTTNKLLDAIKEDGLLREVFNNTYKMLFTEEELDTLSRNLETISILHDEVTLILGGKQGEMSVKSQQIMDNWFEHNKDKFQ